MTETIIFIAFIAGAIGSLLLYLSTKNQKLLQKKINKNLYAIGAILLMSLCLGLLLANLGTAAAIFTAFTIIMFWLSLIPAVTSYAKRNKAK